MPDFLRECGTDRIHSTRKTASRSIAFRRSGEIVDTLVFIIAALLIPAWLLGHLFLTFYPAPESGDSTAIAGSAFGDDSKGSGSAGDSSTGDRSTGNDSDASGPSAKADSKTSVGAGTPNLQLNALTEKSTMLQSKVDSLTKTNDDLTAEIEQLKTAASNMPAPSQAETAATQELQNKLDSQTLELNSTKQSLVDAEAQTKKFEQESKQLQSYVSDLQAKLDQTAADLASAKEAMNNQPASEESDPGSPFAETPMEASTADANLLEEQKAKVSELSAKIKELSYNLENSSDTLSKRDEELRKTKLALEDIRVQNANLKTALDDAKRLASAAPIASTPAGDGLKLMPREVYRDFVSSKGSRSKMAFIRWEGDDIIVRSFSNKRLYRLTLDRFSPDDQQYLLERKK